MLSGEALLIVEGEERPLRQWDFVHCPAEDRARRRRRRRRAVRHAGDRSSREQQAFGPWGEYVAVRGRCAGTARASPRTTQDPDVAYASVAGTRADALPRRLAAR